MAQLSMRALYYVELDGGEVQYESAEAKSEDVKANENYLNQNFTIIAQRIQELEARLSALEG